jgi:hypothetical protein
MWGNTFTLCGERRSLLWEDLSPSEATQKETISIFRYALFKIFQFLIDFIEFIQYPRGRREPLDLDK